MKKNPEKNEQELKAGDLRWSCPVDLFNFDSTAEVSPLENIIGQPRAIEAIRLGAALQSKGYNIFVSGLSGTGRLSTVQKILEEVTTFCPMLYDYCYVYNFENSDTPRLIRLHRKQGKEFSKAISDRISFLSQRLPKIFDEDLYQEQRKKIIEEFQNKEKDVLSHFDEKIKPFGFVRGQLESEQGVAYPEVFPLIEDKPVHIDNLPKFVEKGTVSKEKAEEFYKNYQIFHNELFEIARIGLKLMQDFRKAMADNDKNAATTVVDSAFEDIKKNFSDDNGKVDIYIEEVKKYILDNLNIFVQLNQQGQPLSEQTDSNEKEKFAVFGVNVVLDNSNTVDCPVIIETTPSYTNLFGTIERSYDNRGYWKTDFTKIKAGSLLKADQGYLIVNAMDILLEPGVWAALKRLLLYNKLEIQPYESLFQLSQLHLKPEPIDVNLKVIVIGGQSLYQMLFLYEKGFKKIFKINAQFDYETAINDELINNYSRFIAKICNHEGHTHCTPDAVAAIVEWAVEKAGAKNRITLKFSDVADLVRESSFYVRQSDHNLIKREDVMRAIEERRFRNNLLDEKIKNSIIEGTMLIDTEGERIGQINGLSILSTGVYSFGKPSRITASIGAGNAGIVNIEREVEMSGSVHSKGVLIISGFLRERFAAKKPLTLTASIAFEQSYSGVDGDSASAAEIFVILSAISRIPIKQNFAITGSVNQKGDIQPIGGVNDKIRGFYEICKERGFTGEQGVIIPKQNVKDLMLPQEIIDSVNNGEFHIFDFSKIEDGVPLLMDIEAGEKLPNGKYPKNTLFGKVEIRLDELRKSIKDEKKDNSNKNQKKKSLVKKNK